MALNRSRTTQRRSAHPLRLLSELQKVFISKFLALGSLPLEIELANQ